MGWALAFWVMEGLAMSSSTAILCADGDQLRIIGSDQPAPSGPGFAPAWLATVQQGDAATVVAVGEGRVARYLEGSWEQLGELGQHGLGSTPLRVDARGAHVSIWLRGADPGTVAGELRVAASGPVQVRSGLPPTGERLWQIGAASGGGADPLDFPDALLPLLHEALAAGQEADRNLLLDSACPWGGRLVGPHIGYAGDLPTGPLVHIVDGRAEVIRLDGRTVPFDAAVAFLADGRLLLDGRRVPGAEGPLLVDPQHSIQTLDGPPGPCTPWPTAIAVDTLRH